jgi:hypothetical protein
VVWDLDRPFEGDASLQLLKFTDDEGICLWQMLIIIRAPASEDKFYDVLQLLNYWANLHQNLTKLWW